MHLTLSGGEWATSGLTLALVAVALLVVFLAENSRIPVDDPNTHLELTMIHEVMVLDHGGPDFAFILYGAAFKLWVLGALIVDMVLPAGTGVGGRSIWPSRSGGHVGPGDSGRADRIDDGPAADDARAAIAGRSHGAVGPGPGPGIRRARRAMHLIDLTLVLDHAGEPGAARLEPAGGLHSTRAPRKAFC